ncbi:hypothetical protein ACT43X_18835 (plasmid) [Acinetobacter baumannii]
MKIKVINLDGIKRVVTGDLLKEIDVDYTQSLSDLKADIEFILEPIIDIYQSRLVNRLPLTKKIKNEIFVYEGANHLDIVENGIGSLGLLFVQDNLV